MIKHYGLPAGVQSKKGRRGYVSKGVKIMMGKFTDTAEPSSWKLMNARMTTGKSVLGPN